MPTSSRRSSGSLTGQESYVALGAATAASAGTAACTQASCHEDLHQATMEERSQWRQVEAVADEISRAGALKRSADVEAFTSQFGAVQTRVVDAPASWTEGRANSPVRQIYATWGTGLMGGGSRAASPPRFAGGGGHSSPGSPQTAISGVGHASGAGVLSRPVRGGRERAQSPFLASMSPERTASAVKAGAVCVSKDTPTITAEYFGGGSGNLAAATQQAHASRTVAGAPPHTSCIRRSPSAAAVSSRDAQLRAISKEAVTNIQVDAPDFTPLLEAMARLEAKIAASAMATTVIDLDPIMNKLAFLEARVSANIDVDLSPVMAKLDRLEASMKSFLDTSPVMDAIAQLDLHGKHAQLLEAVHGKHGQVLEAISDISMPAPDMTHITAAVERLDVHGRHAELMDAVSQLDRPPNNVDLSPMLSSLEQLNVHGRHQELLDAVTSIVIDPPDLSSLEQRLEEIRREMRRGQDEVRNELARMVESLQAEIQSQPRGEAVDHGEIAAQLHSRMVQHDFGHSQVLDALGRIQPEVVDLDPLHGAVRSVESQLSTLHNAVREIEMPAYDHSEILKRLDGIVIDIDYDAIAARVYERVVGHHSQVMDAITNIVVDPPDLTPIIDAVRMSERSMREGLQNLSFDIDYTAVADAVHSRVSGHDFGHSEVLRAISEIRIDAPDHDAIADRVHSKVKEHDFGHEEVLRVVSGIKAPDHDAIAERVHSKMREHDFGHGEVLRAVSSIRPPDHDAIADKVHSKMREHDFGHGEVLRAVRNIDLEGVHEAIRRIDLPMYDDSEVLKAVRTSRVDTDDLVEAVHSRLKTHDFGHTEVLRAITNIQVDPPDLTPILEAIRRAEVDLEPLQSALARLTAKLDFSELMGAINRLRLDVDYDAIGDVVAERVPRPDNLEVLQAIKKIKFDPPDYGQLADNLQRRIEPRQVEILAALGKIDLPDTDLSPVLGALESVQAEVRSTEDAVRSIRLPRLDTSELVTQVVAAIQDIIPQLDSQEVVEAVVAKLQSMDFGHSKVLSALKSREVRDVDYGEVEAAVSRAIPPHDNSEVVHALQNMNFQVNFDPVVQVVQGVRQMVDQLRADLTQRPQVIVHDPVPVSEVVRTEPPRTVRIEQQQQALVTPVMVDSRPVIAEPRVPQVTPLGPAVLREPSARRF